MKLQCGCGVWCIVYLGPVGQRQSTGRWITVPFHAGSGSGFTEIDGREENASRLVTFAGVLAVDAVLVLCRRCRSRLRGDLRLTLPGQLVANYLHLVDLLRMVRPCHGVGRYSVGLE